MYVKLIASREKKKSYAKAFQYNVVRTLLILFNFIYVLGEYAGFVGSYVV